MSITKAQYLRLWNKADAILKAPGNPCHIRADAEGFIHCTRGMGSTPGVGYCCEWCRHLTPTGCGVKALGCKLGWCGEGSSTITGMRMKDSPRFAELKAVKDEALKLRFKSYVRVTIENYFQGDWEGEE